MYPNAVYVGETSNRFWFRINNHKHINKRNFSGYPVDMHFNEQSHTMEDLRCITIKIHMRGKDNRVEQECIIKLNTHITGHNEVCDLLMPLLPLSCQHLISVL